MKLFITTVLALVLMVGCIKPFVEREPSFWDQETQVDGIGQLLDSSYVLNNTNERVYSIKFKINWDKIPVPREDAIISVAVYNNNRSIPIINNAANRAEYNFFTFAPPGASTCITFGFITSTGGFTRQFDLMCVDVP